MKQNALISNGLWFDSNAEEAVEFYQSVFPESGIHLKTYYAEEAFEITKRPPGSLMAINFHLFGTEFQAINGGPVFTINPSISYFILCDNEQEADYYWNALLPGGKVMMEIDKYDWSVRYGWLEDRYGLTWQVYTGDGNNDGLSQKICPSLMFVGEQHGKAEAAVHFYTSVFKDSEIEGILKYPAGGTDPEGTVMHSQFKLSGHTFMAMDSAFEHQFQFNEAVSFVVNCLTQEEIDFYWEKLLANGGKVVECGWLRDQFGVSWQVVPVQLDQMLADEDREKVGRVTAAFLHMKKMDLKELEKAFNG